MPLVGRVIPSRHACASATARSDASASEALHQAHATSVTGILKQLGLLATFANDVFTEVTEEAKKTSERMRALGVRVDGLLQHPDAEIEADASNNQTEALKDDAVRFSQKTMPAAMQALYAACETPPPLETLDVFGKSDGACQKKFSHPAFFLEEWMARETARQDAAKAEKAAQRKLKRELRAIRARETPVGLTHTFLTVQTWKEKYGNGEGAELRISSRKAHELPSICIEEPTATDTALPEQLHDEAMEAYVPPPPPPPPANEIEVMDTAAASLSNEKPTTPLFQAAMKELLMVASKPPPPPPASPPPMPPASCEAMDLVPPPPPPPRVVAGVSPKKHKPVSLLHEIQAGAVLRKAELAPVGLPARDDLLRQLQLKQKLRPVERHVVKRRVEDTAPKFTGAIARVLARRAAIAGDSDDDDSDSDTEW
ncbi:hypothetical protein SDRG_05535 [Saprolegnia diclina VS20]|uniref:WASP family protein member n=1 Tax=Saprolegnia diclina (strain VS20) TaxID=1156394 RepID=T0QH68_SAPDV|nr:hypothetical protein SDRG_05535 [Saprolegnia diclina VS20]EQC37314.1 hypothetical protein SDRG_05535 [Saprolegnia diclina VS20]|eukprot:XP_008609476.1 hypothetical protein SDRG_05535 [Saprolegnia diclina VS20]